MNNLFICKATLIYENGEREIFEEICAYALGDKVRSVLLINHNQACYGLKIEVEPLS